MGRSQHTNQAEAAPNAGASWLGTSVLTLGTLGASFGIDVLTGTEVSVFLLYLVPIALATRRLGVGAGLWVALAAGALWVWADQLAGHQYSQPWILWVNAANRLLTFVLGVLGVKYLWRDRDAAVQRWERLTAELAACTQCHAWRAADGAWRTPEQHMQEVGGLDFQPKVCSACARRVYARAAYLGGEDISAQSA